MIETTLSRFDKTKNNEIVKVIIKWGKDRFGETDWTMSCDKLNVIAHSSGGWGNITDINIKLVKCKEWYREMLNSDGYFSIEFVEEKEENGTGN